MPTLKFNLEGDGCWPDLVNKEVIHIRDEISIACLHHGTEEGRPTIAFRFDLPDGRVVFAETTMRLFQTVAKMILAKYGDATDDFPQGSARK